MRTHDGLPAFLSEFLVSAEQRLARIGVLIFELRQDVTDTEVLAELASMFHNLAGAAGAAGFPRMTRRSRYGEGLCSQLRNDQRPPGETELRALLDTLAALKDTLAEEYEGARRIATESTARLLAATILVLEWSDPARQVWLEQLSSAGFVARGVATPEELLAAMVQEPADGIIADADLLARRRFAPIAQIRKSLHGRRPAIVLVGTLRTFEDKVDAIRYGADAYFEHSIPHAQVLQRLKELLGGARPKGANIMVVDDDPVQTTWLRAALEPAGYQVHTCKDPRHFEQELAVARPDLFILDMLLPGGITGADVARYIRQTESHHTTPIIFLSGCSHNQMLSVAAISGAINLEKPVSRDLLLKAVAGCLESTNSRTSDGGGERCFVNP